MNFPRQILDCAWAKPVAFKAELRGVLPCARPQRTAGRRSIQLDRISGSITLSNFRQGQVVRAKGNHASDVTTAVPVGRYSRSHGRHGEGHFQVPSVQIRSSPIPLRRQILPRNFGLRSESGARLTPRPVELIGVSITRTTTRARTIFWKQLCPCGQRPDWLRARPSDEVKFSVSSPRSGQATVPRSRPRHFETLSPSAGKPDGGNTMGAAPRDTRCVPGWPPGLRHVDQTRYRLEQTIDDVSRGSNYVGDNGCRFHAG